jgi:hypothetical protein
MKRPAYERGELALAGVIGAAACTNSERGEAGAMSVRLSRGVRPAVAVEELGAALFCVLVHEYRDQ